METRRSLKNSILIAALATAFSSFTLWLLESWIKYPLFLFEVFAIIVLFLIVSGYNLKTTIKKPKTANLNVGLAIDLFLIASALSLLILNTLQTEGGLLQLFLALMCTSFLPGYALVTMLGLTHHFSKLENLVLSYIVSYAFTGFIAFAFLPLSQDIRTLVTLSSFIMIGSISAFKNRKTPPPSNLKSFSKDSDFLALFVGVTFYAISFFFIYPGFALLPGTDVSRHYAWSIVLGRTPEIYIGSTYLLAHLHESLFFSLSNSSLVSGQTALLALNLMLPLAFYIMARPYLEKIDARLPSLATLFWILFTNSFGGFAWLHFANLRLSTTEQTQLQLLVTTADKTYNGTIYGILGLWYFPATVSFIVLMATIFLMRKREIPMSKYLAVFSTMIAVLYLTHVTEAVVFALFLALYGVISKKGDLRIDDSIKSSTIGFLSVIAIYYIFSLFTPRFMINLSLLISLSGPTLALILSLIFRRVIRPRLPSFEVTLRINSKPLLKALVLSIFFVYSVALMSWTSLTETFHTRQVDIIGGHNVGWVPWFVYPLMLGINGLLAILALYYIAQDAKPHRAFTFFIAFMIFCFMAGKIVSAINLYFFDAGYWEKRFIWLVKLPLATLAPLPILFSIDRLKKKIVDANIKTIASVTLIGTVVLYGVSTTFLNLEYWNIVANNPALHPSSNEMSAIDAFEQILNDDPKAWLTTITSTSAAIATFAAPADRLGLKQLLYTAYRPEMAFTVLYRHPAYTHPYIYLHDRDVEYLNKFSDRFLGQYLNTLPIVYNNSEVKIYDAPRLSSPQPKSDNALIIPFDSFIDGQDLDVAYYMLSQGSYNYTVSYDLDNKALSAKTTILSFDPPQGHSLTSVFQYDSASWTVSKGDWRFDNKELLGGESGRYGEGIILLPAITEDFTASFRVKPQSGDAATLNYVSLVYSWIDTKNYRLADILFSSDGYVYVVFRAIIYGVEETLPNWPGTKTDVKWDFDTEFNVTVAVKGTSNQIAINNNPLLSVELENIGGRIGLRYYRFYAVSFDDFSATSTKSIKLRPIDDYLDYLHSGGKVIVLNTNGYGFFADCLSQISNSTLNAGRIEGKNLKVDLPIEAPARKLTVKDTNATTLAHYVSSTDETSFILKQNYGEGELFYVNIHPIVEAIHKSDVQPAFSKVLGDLLSYIDLPKSGSGLMPEVDGYVKTIRLSNDVEAETDSLLFPLELEAEQVSVKIKDELRNFYDVTSISISKYPTVIVDADSITIEDGEAFYATLKIDSTFTTKPSTGSLDLRIATKQAEITLNDVDHFSVIPCGSLRLLARTPAVKALEVAFVEFYTFGSLQWRTRTYGQDLKVTGLTEFSVILSDSYTALKNVKLGATFQRDPPIVTFDNSSTLPIAVFWTLTLLPIFVSMLFISRYRHDEKRKGIHVSS